MSEQSSPEGTQSQSCPLSGATPSAVLPQTERKAQIRADMEATRTVTLRLLEQVPDALLKVRVHDFYSPVGWHFGHVGMTEEYWVCERTLNLPPLDSALSFLFANLPENPKDNRVRLPDREQIVAYLDATRARVLDALATADLDSDDPLRTDGYAWEFANQHECQHQETIVELLQLIQKTLVSPQQAEHMPGGPPYRCPKPTDRIAQTEMVGIPGGTFLMGSDDPHGYDNEKAAHSVEVKPFLLDKMPITVRQWGGFMQDGGYERPELWSKEGWAWRVAENASRPDAWLPDYEGSSEYYCYSMRGIRIAGRNEPVFGISWYEADAYARWIGKRLPTEAEWEFAARYDSTTGHSRNFPWGDGSPDPSLVDYGLKLSGPRPIGKRSGGASAFGVLDMAGGVWEWTSSPFLPYPGFRAFPYDGYSLDHMDGRHMVCKGGSWASAGPILRCSFRNWYVPSYRQGLLGLRCAADVAP